MFFRDMYQTPDINSSDDVIIFVDAARRSGNETEHECFQPHPNETTIIIVLVDAILSVVTVTGNLLVVSAVIKFRQLRTVTNVFVVGLASADLLVGLNVPYYVLFYFDLDLLACHRTSCMLRYWFAIYASGCSMLCLVGVAIDRYVAILHPLSYHRIMRTRYASVFMVAVWAYMGVVSSLPLMGVGEKFDPTQECDLYYTHTREYALAAVAALVLITFLITTVLYVRIFREAWRHTRAVAALELNHRVSQEARTARTMALVLGVNFLGFLPYLVIITLRYIEGMNQERLSSAKPFVVCCYFGKSAINPIIYGWKNKDFRMAFKKLVLPGKDCRDIR